MNISERLDAAEEMLLNLGTDEMAMDLVVRALIGTHPDPSMLREVMEHLFASHEHSIREKRIRARRAARNRTTICRRLFCCVRWSIESCQSESTQALAVSLDGATEQARASIRSSTNPRRMLASTSFKIALRGSLGVDVVAISSRLLVFRGGAEDVGAQVVARDLPVTLLIELAHERAIEARFRAQRFAQVADRRATFRRVSGLIGGGQRREICAQGFHAHILPISNAESIPFGTLLEGKRNLGHDNQ